MASQFDIEQLANQAVPAKTSADEYSTIESEPLFAKSIRDASALLGSNNPLTYNRLRTITIDTYHRVYLRIASKKITNLSFVYNEETAFEIMRFTLSDSTANFTKEDESKQIRYSRYSGAIRSIVRRITAAELLRYIPLNSSLKFKEDSDDLIEEAYADLDRLLEVVASSAEVETSKSVEEDSTLGQASVYIAYELNKADIPESEFDKPDIDSSPPTYVAPVAIEKVVETTRQLMIPTDRRGVCHIYMTAQAYNADVDLITSRDRTSTGVGTSAGVALKIDMLLPITNADTIDTIIMSISEAINNETLNATYDSPNISATNNYLSNILVAPNYQKPELKSSFAQKKLIHPESTINERRIATFDTYFRTNKLSFESRRYSTKVDTELLIIGFYTIPASTSLPPNNNTSKTLFLKSNNATLGIPGLIYGRGEALGDLQNNSPVSLFLNVQKGNVAAISIKDSATDTGTATEAQDEGASGKLVNQIDTFYFHVDHLNKTGTPIAPAQPVFPLTDNKLVLRISTSNYINEPSRLITVDLSSITYPSSNSNNTETTSTNITADSNDVTADSESITADQDNTTVISNSTVAEFNYIGEEIAALIVDALYDEARTSNLDTNLQSTNVLGAQLGDFDNYYPKINLTTNTMTAIPIEDTTDINELYDKDCGRVQIVAFRYREQEYKAIVDVIKIPKKLWIATGNYQQRRTYWELSRRRSISIETKDLKTSAGNAAEIMTDAEILNSVNASVSQTEARKSDLLQSVYDKKNRLSTIRHLHTQPGYYRRPSEWLS